MCANLFIFFFFFKYLYMTLPSALEKSYSRWLHVSWLCPYSVCPIKTWHTLQLSSSRSSWKGWKVCPQRTTETWNPAAREKLAPSARSHSCSKFALFACGPKKVSSPISAMLFFEGFITPVQCLISRKQFTESQLVKFCSATQMARILSHGHI